MATKPLEEIITKSPEIRKEVEDFANYLWKQRQPEQAKTKEFDIDRVIGMALKEPLNPHPQFKSEDDLWE